MPPRATGERDGGPGAGADGNSGRDDPDGDAPTFSLTATQVAASMSAAVVAAFIGAQLGVAGTIVGAAIASVVSVVGSAVIGHSLLLTRRKVTQTVHHVRVGAGSPMDADRTVLLTAVTRQIDIERAVAPPLPVHRPATGPATGTTTGPPTGTPTGPPTGSAPDRKGRWARPGRWRLVLVGLAASAAVFAGAIGAVTVVEAVTGAPISGGESGYSVLGGNGGTGSGDAPSSSSPATVTGTTTEAPATSAPTASSPGSSAPTSTPSSIASSTTSTTASTAPSTTASTAPSATSGASSAPATTAGAGTARATPAG